MKRAHDETTKKLIGQELNDEIYKVVMDGNVSGLRELLETYDDVTERDIDGDGWKALHVTTFYGHFDVAKLLIQNGADVNAVDKYNDTSLQVATSNGHVDIAKLLIQNGAYVNAMDEDNESVLYCASHYSESVSLTLELLCLGAKIDKKALKDDKTGLLVQIEERLEKLRNGEYRITNLCSNEENKFKWNLAFCLTLKYKVAAFKAYYSIRSFITYHGIFMAPGYDFGKESIWRK
jgi:ankyrin repeat protein